MSKDNDQPPRRRGRPRTRPDNPVGIRCEFSPEEHHLVEQAARASGVALAAFARAAAVEAARKALKRLEGR